MFNQIAIDQWLKGHENDEASQEKAKKAKAFAIRVQTMAKSPRTVRFFIPNVFGGWTRETHKLEIEFLAQCWGYGPELDAFIDRKS